MRALARHAAGEPPDQHEACCSRFIGDMLVSKDSGDLANKPRAVLFRKHHALVFEALARESQSPCDEFALQVP
jgi:hypothetical protein